MEYRIGIIYTGGTIGMDMSQNGLTASGDFRDKFFHYLPEYHQHSAISFTFVEYPEPIDSAHADLRLATDIFFDIEKLSSQVDACLVLMGSDTLAYIAACLAYLRHQLQFPVLVTGAMKPLSAPATDARANLNLAISLLHEKQLQGVHVVFGGHCMPAVRCTKLYTHTQAALVSTASHSLHANKLWPLTAPLPQPNLNFTDYDIRVIRAMPSLHRNFLTQLFSGTPDAIIVQCYGSGTAPAEQSEFAQALKAIAARNVPVFAISQTLGTMVDFSAYAASAWLDQLGIIRCGDMNLEATYTKLWYLLNMGYSGADLGQVMQTNLCGEISCVDDVNTPADEPFTPNKDLIK